MYDRFGIDLRPGKEGLVAARLGKKLRKGGFASFSAYLDAVLADSSGGALVEMVDALTTNHTSFLRERAHFDFLRDVITSEFQAPLRIWSAACSTGEEPYSIACCLLDARNSGKLSRTPGARPCEILATDLSSRALQKAQEAIYPSDRFREFPPSWFKAFLLKGTGEWKDQYRLKPEVTSLVEFRRLNLMESFAHSGRFQVIFCRNVMMYFDRRTQQDLVRRLAVCLEPGGYLLVGHSETLTGIEHGLRYVRPAVYRSELASKRRP
jgi:chemotaxis protein methyltransferase CheR